MPSAYLMRKMWLPAKSRYVYITLYPLKPHSIAGSINNMLTNCRDEWSANLALKNRETVIQYIYLRQSINQSIFAISSAMPSHAFVLAAANLFKQSVREVSKSQHQFLWGLKGINMTRFGCRTPLHWSIAMESEMKFWAFNFPFCWNLFSFGVVSGRRR